LGLAVDLHEGVGLGTGDERGVAVKGVHDIVPIGGEERALQALIYRILSLLVVDRRGIVREG